MAKRTSIFISILILAIFAFGVAVFWPDIIKIKESVLVSEKTKTTNLPQGDFLFNVVSNEGDAVKFVEGDINPPDVHVGDVQKFRLVIESPRGVQDVTAHIETDNNIFSVSLRREKVATIQDLLPFQYAIQNGALIEVSRLNQKTENFGKGSIVSEAIAEETPMKEVWIGEWKVEDTHDAIYHTTFVAKDDTQNKAELVVAWSDACAIPLGGDWNLASYGNCTISSLDGVDNGNVTISTYTLTLNNKFAFNPGKNISIINGGQVVVGVGGGFVKENIYMSDADIDGYPSSISQSTSSLISGARRRYQLTSYNSDCDDANAAVYTGTVSSQGCTVTNECSNTCSGTQTRTCQSNGTFTAFSACGGCTPAACCQNGYLDGDLDGDGAGAYGCYSSGTIVANNNDCDDTNASIKSGSTRTRYQSSTPGCGTACASETQTCSTGGVWSGTYSGTSCTASTQTRYGALTSACGTYSSTSETQTCQTNGTWSPNNYSLTSAPAATTQTRYVSSYVACGTSCTSETQTCQSNGSFSGTYTYSSCSVDPGSTYYWDGDGDGYGISSPTTNACSQPGGYASNSSDCNDASSLIYQTIPSVVSDADHDGYRVTTFFFSSACVGGSQSFNGRTYYLTQSNVYELTQSWLGDDDCNDASASVWRYGAYADADGDGYGAGSSACYGSTPPAGYVLNNSDCNDSYSSISPSAGAYSSARPDGGGWDWNCSGSVTSVNGGGYKPSIASSWGSWRRLNGGACGYAASNFGCSQGSGTEICGVMGSPTNYCDTQPYFTLYASEVDCNNNNVQTTIMTGQAGAGTYWCQ